jgi:hypothetical protein
MGMAHFIAKLGASAANITYLRHRRAPLLVLKYPLQSTIIPSRVA